MDYKTQYLKFIKKYKNNLPNGIYPDYDELSGLSEPEKYFFHYSDFGNLEIVKYIHKYEGVDVDVKIPNGFSAGFTPLMWAAMKGHFPVVKYLIDNGADVNSETVDGDNVLVKAVWNFGDIEIVKLLLGKGADINSVRTNDKKSILTIAIENCNQAVAKYLISKGADVIFPNKTKSSGLFYARKYKLGEIVELLKEKGAK
jgi:ankyrin repeat protein